ncbi:MAG: alanine racemase [Planctomycetota bacterium]
MAGLDTPCLLLDRGRLDGNIARFETKAKALGVGLRTHMKTAKSLEVAARMPSVAARGITVSTLKEAEYFAAGGVRDILLAVCIPPQKVARAAALARAGTELKLAVDDAAALAALQATAREEQTALDVLVEVDCGEHRSGVAPDSDELLALASDLDGDEWTRFAGVYTHGGHSYGATTPDDRLRIARAERDAVLEAAERLRTAGLDCPIRSVGSTPTFACVDALDGITEARPGVYVFGDLFQAGIGSCELTDIALSVLTTVIGVRSDARRLLVDAGGLALSKDRSTASLGDGDCGYGLVCDLTGAPLKGLHVDDAYQEHGIIDLPPWANAEDFGVGTRLRILPNHACMTAAAHDRYHVLDGEELVATWGRVNAWD